MSVCVVAPGAVGMATWPSRSCCWTLIWTITPSCRLLNLKYIHSALLPTLTPTCRFAPCTCTYANPNNLKYVHCALLPTVRRCGYVRYHPKMAVPKTAVSLNGRVSTNQGICWYGMVLIIGLRTAILGYGRFGNGLSGT
jgi:hypothetical protein